MGGYTDIMYKLKKVGKNVQIAPHVYIRYPELVEIGNNVIIDEFVHITTALKLGDFIHIGPQVSIIGGRKSKLVMRDFSGLSAGAIIVCTSDDFSGRSLTNPAVPENFRSGMRFSTIEIGRHCVIGTNSVVMPGVKIGDGSVIGTMSLAIKNVKPWGVYFGVPVKKIYDRDRQALLAAEKRFKKNR